ncbi:MAG: hypothetical protein JHD16_11520 [Solirubrobacteraceae bacterium]|nr:hypothetical protein [Solirubrobacteraceae bacterium]
MFHRPFRRGRAGSLVAGVATALALAAPISASAIAPADVPDIGADTGRFTLPITCDIKVPALGNLQVLQLPGTVDIQGIAPVQLAPGQPFYLSQGAGALTLPAWLSTLGGLVTVDRADAVVDQLYIGATRSTPSSINLSTLTDLTVKDIPLVPGKPIVVGLPKTGTFNVGPYTAPQDGRTALKFEGARATVTVRSRALGLAIKVRAYCKAAASAGGGASLLAIAVGGPPNSTPINIQNNPLNFAKAPYNALIGIVNAPFTCSYTGNTYNVGVAVQGTIPLAVKRGRTLPVLKASGALTVPKETVNQWLDEGKTELGGTVTKLELVSEGATPAVTNVIPAGGIPIPPTTLVRDQKLIVPLPATGTLTAGPFAPTATASAVILKLGTAAANLTFDGGTASAATCDAPFPDSILVDAAVT